MPQPELDPLASVPTREFGELFEPHARKGRSARLDRMSRNDVVIMLARDKRVPSPAAEPRREALRVLKIFTVANVPEIEQFRDAYLEEYKRDQQGFCERDYSVFNFFRNYVSFETEARLLSRARSFGADRIVPLLGLHRLRGIPGSELFADKTLNALELPYLDKYFPPGPGRWREAVSDAIEILEAVHQLHSLFLAPTEYPTELQIKLSRTGEYLHPIHLDINPDQVLRDPNGRLVLIDFGCSRVFDDHLQRTTIPGVYTPLYSPPEQLRGIRKSELDYRDYRVEVLDVYPLAIMLFESLSGLDFSDRVLRATSELREHAAVVEYRQKHFEADLKAVQADDEFEEVRSALFGWILACTEVAWEDRRDALLRLLGNGQHGWRGEWPLAIRSADYLAREVLGRTFEVELAAENLPTSGAWTCLCEPGAEIPLSELVRSAQANGAPIDPASVRWFFRGQPRFGVAEHEPNYPVVWNNQFRPWWPGRYELFPTQGGVVDWEHPVTFEVLAEPCQLALGFEGRSGAPQALEEEIALCDGLPVVLGSYLIAPDGQPRPTPAVWATGSTEARAFRLQMQAPAELTLSCGVLQRRFRLRSMGTPAKILAETKELCRKRSCTPARFRQLDALFRWAEAAGPAWASLAFTLGSNLWALARAHGIQSPALEGRPAPAWSELDGLGRGEPWRVLVLNNYLSVRLSQAAALRAGDRPLLQELAEALEQYAQQEPVRSHRPLLLKNLETFRGSFHA